MLVVLPPSTIIMVESANLIAAVIALGSNIEPHSNITKAFAELDKRFAFDKKAQLLHTKPVDVVGEQPDFINTGCLLHTPLTQEELLAQLKQIEMQMGRKPMSSSEPRIIDLDLVVWDGLIIDQDVYTRDFLQTIVIELLPDMENQISSKHSPKQ